MSDIDPKKLKVADLREELKQRGLDTKGNKNVLVKRLQEALAAEIGEDVEQVAGEESLIDTTTEEIEDPAPGAVEEREQLAEEETVPPENTQAETEDISPNENETENEQAVLNQEEEQGIEDEVEAEQTPADEPEKAAPHEEEEKGGQAEEEDVVLVPEGEDEATKPTEETNEAPQQDEEVTLLDDADTEDGIPLDGEFEVMDSVGDTEGMEVDDDKRGEKRRRSRSRDRDRDRHSRRSRRSRSRSPRKHRSRSGSRSRQRQRSQDRRDHQDRHEQVKVQEEKDDWLEATNFQLDRFNSDLNMRIREGGTKANPITVEGFAFMWAGSRSNYGVTKGKVAFEVKILDHLNVDHLPPEEVHLHVVRVGWSTNDTSFQLGEEPYSYGYGGTGKAAQSCKFTDYGSKFGNGDVIGVYMDFESDPMEISYTKNGEDLGKCFEIPKEGWEDRALFAHILTKNTEFEVNFGEKEEPFFPIKEGYSWISTVPLEERVRGTLPCTKKEECEMIMMCGLPGAGKTVWAAKHSAENKEKRFNVLGTNTIIDKMKVNGLPRKNNYAGRWDVLIDKSTRCLTRLLEIASQKKRNYILDQTNVYPSAQRRKMRLFEGFQRKAVVLVPTDEEYKKRCEKREKEEGKDVPDSAVLEMKANFALPEEGNVFDKVEFVELEKEEATKLVEKYNKEGRDALPPPDKRYRDTRYGVPTIVGRDYNRDNRYNSRGGGRGFGGRGGYDNRRGGGHSDRRGGYMGYSSNDRRRHDDRSYDRRDNRSNYDNRRHSGGSSSGYKSGGWGNQGGNWGNQGSLGNQGSSWNTNQAGGSWGGQNYQNSWGGQWGGYPNQQQNQGWGQNYNYNWNNQGNWNTGSGYNQGQGSWGSYGSNYNSNYHK